MTAESHSEFAVFVEDVGAVSVAGSPINPVVGADEPTVFDRSQDAEFLARRVCMDYERLSMSQMANKVRVFVRTVTVTRGGWNSGLPVHPLFAATDGASR